MWIEILQEQDFENIKRYLINVNKIVKIHQSLNNKINSIYIHTTDKEIITLHFKTFEQSNIIYKKIIDTLNDSYEKVFSI